MDIIKLNPLDILLQGHIQRLQGNLGSNLYSNYDNTEIPILEALRIVSLAQDEKTDKADLYLLKAQKRYKTY